MKTLRVIAAVAGALSLGYGVLWGGAFMGWKNPAVALPILFGATIAAMLWWFALRGHDPISRHQMYTGCLGGLIVGGIGFAVGFVGPMLLKPGANQGPLLGILITGPGGFVVGIVAAVALAKLRARRSSTMDRAA